MPYLKWRETDQGGITSAQNWEFCKSLRIRFLNKDGQQCLKIESNWQKLMKLRKMKRILLKIWMKLEIGRNLPSKICRNIWPMIWQKKRTKTRQFLRAVVDSELIRIWQNDQKIDKICKNVIKLKNWLGEFSNEEKSV